MFSSRSQWNITLPDYASWAKIFRWIDRWEKMVYRVEEEAIRMWLPASVGDGFLLIQPENDVELSLTLDHHEGVGEKEVMNFLSQWWDLDRDMSPFYAAFQEDPLLGDSMMKNRGARIVGFPELFEALVLGILGQQVNVQFAYTLKQRITEAYGNKLIWKDEVWWRFPEPESILRSSVAELREMQVSTRKAEYILGVAEAMANHAFTKESLHTLDLADQMRTLTALRGIGPWTAQYVCMKCLHTMEAFPAGDAGLQNSVRDILKMERKPTIEELYELAANWKGWEAYAVWFLWMN